MSDLQRAFKALSNKASTYNVAWRYYDGDQPLVYSTTRLRQAFQNIKAHFEQNWCAVVVDAVLDRLVLKGISATSAADTQKLKDAFSRMHMELDAYDAHLSALVTHEAYIIVWKDEEGETQSWYNDPRLCHLFYKSDDPKRKDFACKWWVEESDELPRLNLYYPDRIEHYKSEIKKPREYTAFKEDPDNPEEKNEYGVIPVFHLRVDRRGKGSELSKIDTLQDAVNKILADMMVAGEFGAWMQRWIITNGDVSTLKNAPYENWVLPASDGQDQATQVGQFQAADLTGFLEAIDKLASSIAIITRTPKHYFYSAGTGISGEALLAMEAPLVKKVKQRHEIFSVTWQEIGAFVLQLEGGVTVEPSDLTPIWEPAGSIQPLTEAEARKTSVDAGIPLETELRREGWSSDELTQLDKDKAKEKDSTTSMATALLEQARIRQEQQNMPGNNNQMPMKQNGNFGNNQNNQQ